MLAIGPGPGPRNVLVELPDGSKTVVAYRTWKYKYAPFSKKETHIAEKQFRTVHGVIQFDPKDGEAGGKPVRNIVVQQNGFGPTAVRVYATVWPSHAHISLNKGDVVTFEGPYSQNKVQTDEGPRTFHNISVSRLFKHGAVDEGARERTGTVNGGAADDVSDEDIPF
ncbi:MAG: hypothetical protein KGL39_38005 [Patescibacteria group bacterium]|nr:hypothetical protein [Patescibacteria group bacterium]